MLGGGALRKWLSHEGGAIMNGIRGPYKKRPRRAFLPPFNMWRHREKIALSEPGKGLSSDTESTSNFIFDFQASRTVRHKGLLLKPLSLRHFCCSCPKWLRNFFLVEINQKQNHNFSQGISWRISLGLSRGRAKKKIDGFTLRRFIHWLMQLGFAVQFTSLRFRVQFQIVPHW